MIPLWRGIARSGFHMVQVMVRRIRLARKLPSSALAISSTCLKTLKRGGPSRSTPVISYLDHSSPESNPIEEDSCQDAPQEALMSFEEMNREPWPRLVQWIGVDSDNHPVLCVRLGEAVRTLNSQDELALIKPALLAQADFGLNAMFSDYTALSAARRAEEGFNSEGQFANQTQTFVVRNVDPDAGNEEATSCSGSILSSIQQQIKTPLLPSSVSCGETHELPEPQSVHGRMSVVVDCEGLGLGRRPPLDLTQSVLLSLGQRYQGRLHHTYMVKVGSLVLPAVHMVRSFLSNEVKEKIHILGTSQYSNFLNTLTPPPFETAQISHATSEIPRNSTTTSLTSSAFSSISCSSLSSLFFSSRSVPNLSTIHCESDPSAQSSSATSLPSSSASVKVDFNGSTARIESCTSSSYFAGECKRAKNWSIMESLCTTPLLCYRFVYSCVSSCERSVTRYTLHQIMNPTSYMRSWVCLFVMFRYLMQTNLRILSRTPLGLMTSSSGAASWARHTKRRSKMVHARKARQNSALSAMV